MTETKDVAPSPCDVRCQREAEMIARQRDAEAATIPFVVKDNQPELKANIAESFGDPSPLRSRPLRSKRGGARERVGERGGRAA